MVNFKALNDLKNNQLSKKEKVITREGTLEYVKMGVKQPNIVFINGSGGPLMSWASVINNLVEIGTIFAYNRFGIEGSDKPIKPQTGKVIVSMLKEALVTTELEPPYILVGHSLGGLYANLYTRLFSDEVAGVILIESAHPDEVKASPPKENVFIEKIKLLSPMLAKVFNKNVNSEINHIYNIKKEIMEAGAFPDIPLYVVAGGKKPSTMPDKLFQGRQDNLQNLLTLSPKSKLFIASSSGHFPQITEPGVVVAAIKELVNSIQQTNER